MLTLSLSLALTLFFACFLTRSLFHSHTFSPALFLSLLLSFSLALALTHSLFVSHSCSVSSSFSLSLTQCYTSLFASSTKGLSVGWLVSLCSLIVVQLSGHSVATPRREVVLQPARAVTLVCVQCGALASPTEEGGGVNLKGLLDLGLAREN